MPSNLSIDDELLEEALSLGGFRTKKDTVNTALREFIERKKQLEIIDVFGTMDPDPDYDYKKARSR